MVGVVGKTQRWCVEQFSTFSMSDVSLVLGTPKVIVVVVVVYSLYYLFS